MDFVGGIPASNDKRLISRAPMWHNNWICMSVFLSLPPKFPYYMMELRVLIPLCQHCRYLWAVKLSFTWNGLLFCYGVFLFACKCFVAMEMAGK